MLCFRHFLVKSADGQRFLNTGSSAVAWMKFKNYRIMPVYSTKMGKAGRRSVTSTDRFVT